MPTSAYYDEAVLGGHRSHHHHISERRPKSCFQSPLSRVCIAIVGLHYELKLVVSTTRVAGCDRSAVAKVLRARHRSRIKMPFTDRERAIHKHLPIIAALMRDAGIPAILGGGTALAFTRECAAIPGDPDADLLVPRSIMEQPGRLEKLHKAMREAGYKLRDSWRKPGQAGWQMTIKPKGQGMYLELVVVDEDYETQGFAKPPCRWTWYLHGDGGKQIRRCTTGPFHFQFVAWLNTTFWIPSPMKNHLVGEYGYGWGKPGGSAYEACYGASPQPSKTGTMVVKTHRRTAVTTSGFLQARASLASRPHLSIITEARLTRHGHGNKRRLCLIVFPKSVLPGLHPPE